MAETETSHLSAVLGHALQKCVPALQGWSAGGMAEAAACDQAAAEYLTPVVRDILGVREKALLHHMYSHEIVVRVDVCACLCGAWEHPRGGDVRRKHIEHVVAEFFKEGS